jgi:hypothetical protein
LIPFVKNGREIVHRDSFSYGPMSTLRTRECRSDAVLPILRQSHEFGAGTEAGRLPALTSAALLMEDRRISNTGRAQDSAGLGITADAFGGHDGELGTALGLQRTAIHRRQLPLPKLRHHDLADNRATDIHGRLDNLFAAPRIHLYIFLDRPVDETGRQRLSCLPRSLKLTDTYL